MRKQNEKVIAILLADIHLSLKAPIWRSAEPDWFEAQHRPLEEVKLLQDKYNCPIFCAGDIFENWDSKPELINFALAYLPDEMYSVPGQHDLPLHKYSDISKSAYWTLVKAEKITNIAPETSIIHEPFEIFGFPFGQNISKPYNKSYGRPAIAIIHDYIWSGKHHYPNAPKEKEIERQRSKFTDGKLYGYDVIVYGDNHKGFLVKVGKTTIFNCGTLMRRKSDEINYKPQVGLLMSSGKVIPYCLDISEDKYLEISDNIVDEEDELEMKEFIQELEKLGDIALDFVEAMKEFFRREKPNSKIKEIILKAMEK